MSTAAEEAVGEVVVGLIMVDEVVDTSDELPESVEEAEELITTASDVLEPGKLTELIVELLELSTAV